MYPIYCISGLGADYRVFKHLEKDFNLIHIPWIEPKLNEDLLTYGKRLIQNINFPEKFYLLGVSFGGLVAQKLNEIIHPQQLILVSTFAKGRSPSLLYKVLTTCRINTLFSPNLFSKFGVLNSLFFGVKKTEDKELLKKIILDTNRQLFVWATCEIVKFKPLVEEDNFVAIHGKKDLVIPNGGHDTFEINDAGHLAVLTHANLVKTIIYEHVIKRPI